MAKRKVDIAKRLNALNPGEPTRTRKKGETGAGQKEPARTVQSRADTAGAKERQVLVYPFVFAEMFQRNISAMEKLRTSFVEDAFRFQGFFFEGWSRNCGLVWEAIRTNFDYTGSR